MGYASYIEDIVDLKHQRIQEVIAKAKQRNQGKQTSVNHTLERSAEYVPGR